MISYTFPINSLLYYSMIDMLRSPIVITARKTLLDHGVKPGERILAGVSGGVDSMVMLVILSGLGYKVEAAHVNFQLRGEDSDLDHELVRNWCEAHGIQFFEHTADTLTYAEEHNLNIQSAARHIRQKWWLEVCKEHGFTYVATAHHHDDNIETFFINVLRGTGLKGLKGISTESMMESGLHFIRPIIRVSRSSIELFAEEYKIPFRHDQSNFKDDYLRNKLRHHVIPELKKIAGQEDGFLKHMLLRTDLEWKAWEVSYQDWQQDHLVKDLSGIFIKGNSKDHAYMLRWLEEQGIPWSLSYDFIHADHQVKGKSLTYGNFVLSKATEGFYFEKSENFYPIIINSPGEYLVGEQTFLISTISKEESQFSDNPNEEFVSSSVIRWPLTIRTVEPGDSFQPIGMSGMSKKLQDLLVDLKLDQHEKKKVRVLCNEDHIIWVMGYRMDERAKMLTEEVNGYVLKIDL